MNAYISLMLMSNMSGQAGMPREARAADSAGVRSAAVDAQYVTAEFSVVLYGKLTNKYMMFIIHYIIS